MWHTPEQLWESSCLPRTRVEKGFAKIVNNVTFLTQFWGNSKKYVRPPVMTALWSPITMSAENWAPGAPVRQQRGLHTPCFQVFPEPASRRPGSSRHCFCWSPHPGPLHPCLTFASVQFRRQVVRHREGRCWLLAAREFMLHPEAVQALQTEESMMAPHSLKKPDLKKQPWLWGAHNTIQVISELFTMFDRPKTFTPLTSNDSFLKIRQGQTSDIKL